MGRRWTQYGAAIELTRVAAAFWKTAVRGVAKIKGPGRNNRVNGTGTTLDLPNVQTVSTRREANRQMDTTPFDANVDKKRGPAKYERWSGQTRVPPYSKPAVRGKAMPMRLAVHIAGSSLAKSLTTGTSQTTRACACASREGPAQNTYWAFHNRDPVASRTRTLETEYTTACSAG